MAYTDIDNPSETAFNTKLYTGTGGTQNITGVGFQPDLVWIKNRSDTHQHVLSDSVRGTGKELRTDITAAETTNGDITAFGSDGFSISSNGQVSNNGNSYASWNWKKEAGVMDIVTYTGNGSNRTIAHNLGVKPAVMVHKGRSNTYNWGVYHHALSPSNERSLNFNTTGAVNVDDGGVYYNSTDPTSSVFSLGTNVGYNANGATYVAYLFAEKKGYSKFSSYTGNGNADGTFIYTGFKPAFFLIKNINNASDDWHIMDNKRNGYNPQNNILQPNLNDAEGSSTRVDFLSNGVKINSSSAFINGSGETIIYMAFAENPFVTSTGVPATAR